LQIVDELFLNSRREKKTREACNPVVGVLGGFAETEGKGRKCGKDGKKEPFAPVGGPSCGPIYRGRESVIFPNRKKGKGGVLRAYRNGLNERGILHETTLRFKAVKSQSRNIRIKKTY